MKVNIFMQSNNVKHRERYISSVLFNARTLILTLVITMTMVMGTALFTNSIAYAQSGDGATVRVATFDQLRDALGNGGVSDIIIDPQAAEEFADNEGEEISFDGSDVFYIPIEYPLVVSHDVTITSEVAVNFARSGNGGSGKYDSKAFRGQNEVTPALFNIDQGKTLVLEGDIAMTGEEVSATFDSAQGSFLFTVKARDNMDDEDDEDDNDAWSYGSDPGKLSKGGYFIYTKGGNVVMNDGVLLMGLNTLDNVRDIAPVYIDGTAKAATLTVDGAEIYDNNLGQTEDGKSTAGAVILKGSKATAALNSGEISKNNADVAGIIVKEEAELDLGNDFEIDDSDIYDEKAEEAAKEEAAKEEAAKEEAAKEETEEAPIVVAPKKSLKSSKSSATQMRNMGNQAATSQTPSDSDTQKTVATSKQLKAALENDSVTTIIIDPTGALNEVKNTNADGVMNPEAPEIESSPTNPNKIFYLPVDEPLTVDRAVTIKTKNNNTQAIITRSDQFTATEPIFTVASGGNLTLSKGVVMTGDKVDSVYDYTNGASGYDPGQGYSKPLDDGVLQLQAVDKKYFGVLESGMGGAKWYNFALVDPDKAQKLYVNSAGYMLLEYKKETDASPQTYHINSSKSLIGGTPSGSDLKLRELKADGTLADVSKLATGKIYVVSTYDSINKTEKFLKSDLNFTNAGDTNSAMKFKAASTVDDFDNEDTEELQYEPVKFKFDVEKKTWSQTDAPTGTKEDPKGFFIQVNSGGTLNLNGAILKEYKTIDSYSASQTDASQKSPVWSAPVVVMGTFNMTAGEITGNRVGYCADDVDSKWKAQHIKNKLLTTDLTNTAGGVLFKGSSATGSISGTGVIRRNKGDAGGIIVTDNAKVTLDGAADGSSGGGIDGNLGWHHAGAALVDQGGTLHMKGGHMVNNTTWNRGGAVWATEWGTNGLVRKGGGGVVLNSEIKGTGGNFVMDNGKLDNNMAFIRGGAINVESDGVQLINGYITNNKCKSLGGAIYVEGDSADYTYTLVIKQGYISNNTAVQGKDTAASNITLAKKIDSTKDDPMQLRADLAPADDWDKDFPGIHNGNGGGIWLCPLGGTSVLAYNNTDAYKVVIDGNTSTHGSKTWYGDDFYICRGKGSALVQNLAGDWYDDHGNKKNFTNGTIINGMVGFYNNNTTTSAAGVQITGNRSRDGGGIAANGTLILGKPEDVHRYTAKLDITKEWQGIEPDDITLKLFYKNGDTRVQISSETLKGEANTSFSENDDAVNQIIEGSPTDNDTKWHATVELPAIYKDKDGNEYVLYEIEDPDNPGTAINLRTTVGIAKLYNAIANNRELKILNWYLELEESTGNFSTIKTFHGIIDKAQAIENINLVNPVNNQPVQNGQFSITFSTITFGETLVNKLKNIELTKVGANDQPLPNATFEVHPLGRGSGSNSDNIFVLKSKVEENNAENPGADDPMEVVQSDDEGKITLTTLDVNSMYFLFETSVGSDGKYKRAESPWLIEVDDNGNATTKKIKDEKYGMWHNAKAGNNYEEKKSTYSDNEEVKNWVTNKRWKYSWFENTDTAKTLENEWTPLVLTKIDASTEEGKQGATFELYEVESRNDLGIRNSEHNVDIVAPVNSETLVSGDDGTITLPISKPGLYMLFETNAPTGYARAKSPWLIYVDEDKNVKVVAIMSGQEGRCGYYSDGSYPWGERIYPSTRDELNDWVIRKWWKKEWYNLTDDTVTHNKNNANPYSPTDSHYKIAWRNDSSSQFITNNELSNSKVDIELTKTNDADTPVAITDKTAKFMLFEANVSPADLFDNDGNPKTDNKNVRVLDRHSPIGGDSNGVITTDSGVLSLNNLDTNKIYLLFETEAPAGYQRSKAPWLIWVNNVGDYRMFKYVANTVNFGANDNNLAVENLVQGATTGWFYTDNNGNNKGEYTLLGSMVFPTTTQIDDKLNYSPNGTNGFNYVEQIGNNKSKLKNAPIEIEFDKIIKGTDDKLTTAKFDLYYATVGSSTNHANGLVYKVDTSKPNNGLIQSDIAYTDGKYKVTIPASNQIYLLYETTVPEGYVDPVVPWGIYVDADGGIEALDNTQFGIWGLDPALSNSDVEGIRDRFEGETDRTNIYLECKEIKQLTTYKLENEKPKTTLKARKVWKNKDGNTISGPPASTLSKITFKLYRVDDGEMTYLNQYREITAPWTTVVEFANLPVYDYDENGQATGEIQYEIKEDAVSGYIPSYAPDANDSNITVVTNQEFKGGKVKLTVDKSWKDIPNNEDAASLKKDVEIEVWYDNNVKDIPQFYRDGITLNESNNWTVTLTGEDALPMYSTVNASRKLKYWIKEKDVDGFTLVSTSEYVPATNSQTSNEQNYIYTGYTSENTKVGGKYQFHGGYNHRIAKKDGTEEIVYCINTNYKAPELDTGTQYRRIEITPENAHLLKNYMQETANTYTYKDEHGRTQTMTSPATYSVAYKDYWKNNSMPKNYTYLYYALLKLAYYGYGGQDNDWLVTKNLDDDYIRHLTQYAFYEYTDFYYLVKDQDDYRVKDEVGYYTAYYNWQYGPFGLTRNPRSDDKSGYTYRINSQNALQNDYLALLSKIEGTSDEEIAKLGLKLYIYKPITETNSGGRRYQNLVGVETSEINLYASLTNEFHYDEIELYKYGIKTLDQTDTSNALKKVRFTLYEETDANDPDKYTGAPIEGIPANVTVKVKKTGLETDDEGKVKIQNLIEGKLYYLVETATNSNYILNSKAIAFKMSRADDAKTSHTLTGNETDPIVLKWDGVSNTTSSITPVLNVPNIKEFNLPKSGGMGTYWFMIIGAMMMGFALTAGFSRMDLRKLLRR